MPDTKVTKEIKSKDTTDTEPPVAQGELEVDDEDVEKIAALVVQKAQIFSGPIPSPEILEGYNQILPDAAERIFKMAEKAQDHQMSIEHKYVDSRVDKIKKGQYFALTLALFGITGAVVCAFLGETTIGAIIGGTTLVSIVPSFIDGVRKKKDDENGGDADNEDPNEKEMVDQDGHDD